MLDRDVGVYPEQGELKESVEPIIGLSPMTNIVVYLAHCGPPLDHQTTHTTMLHLLPVIQREVGLSY